MRQQFSRHWIWVNEGQWSLRDGKQKRWALQSPKLTALIEFPDCGIGRRNWGRAQKSPWIEVRKLRIWGDQGTKISQDRTHKRRPQHREEKYGSFRQSVFSGVLISACMWENVSRTKIHHLKVTVPAYIQDWEQHLFPPVKLENLMIYGDWIEYRRMENNWLYSSCWHSIALGHLRNI